MRAVLLAALLVAPPAFAPAVAQDGRVVVAQDGRTVFERRCASCHAVDPAAPPMAGPSLHGVLGRRVGTAPGFDYSPVLEQAGRGGDTWDADRLLLFLEDPEEMYPGLWMGANGLRAEADRRAVVEWLQAAR